MADHTNNDWYTITDLERLDSPALVIYPSRVKDNIRRLKEMLGGDTARLRPHVKTNKSPDATRLLLDAGIYKFKCATIAEAEMLAICGARDVLLAYQPVGPKLQRFLSLIGEYPATKFSCLIDNTQAAEEMDRVFSAAHRNVPVYIDLNLGMNRTGIAPGEDALRLYKKASVMQGITPVGLHAYDGHIRDEDLQQRTLKCDAAFAKVTELAALIASQHAPADPTPATTPFTAASSSSPAAPGPIIIAGGSPTLPIHCKRPDVECSPGTFIYWDKGYRDACPEQPFTPAALVITRVISLPDPTTITLDLGHKSVAAENELAKRVYFLNAPELIPISQSEEHLVMDAGPAHGYRIGDVLYGLPMHICPTVADYERAFTIENGRCTGEWITRARDRAIRF
jgi:D-serine deaminase-like pyridoxal phosphate-dependent protein